MKASGWSQASLVVLGIAMGFGLATFHQAQADPPQKETARNPGGDLNRLVKSPLEVSPPRIAQEHQKWIGDVLNHLQTIKPGMKRAELNRLFTSEGGIRVGLTYVYRECPFIKVDVEFKRAPETKHDKEGRVTSGLSPNDEIISVSTPYLQYSIMD